MEALFSQSSVSMTVMDDELPYRSVNAAAVRDSGVPAEQLISRHIGDNTPDLKAIEELLRQVRDTGGPAADFHVRGRLPTDPDHERAWSGCSFRLTDPADALLGMCQTYADIADGLIGAPGQNIDIGLDRLARTVAAPDRPLEQLGDAVVALLSSGRRQDDAAVLLARPRAPQADRVALGNCRPTRHWSPGPAPSPSASSPDGAWNASPAPRNSSSVGHQRSPACPRSHRCTPHPRRTPHLRSSQRQHQRRPRLRRAPHQL
ncbi:PAS domain-containing protein [Streptomyces malaysiensis]|uniref:PAS domain-containing protein n=1 Tax=Streptomyces malaysiensis TaxID=92644 RepID=UPI003558562E